MNQMKRCNTCGEEFLATSDFFHIRLERPDGLCSRCKTCRLESQRKYRENNREKLIRKKKAYREQNREKIKGYNQKYYAENSEKRIEYSLRYNQINSENVRKQRRKYRKTHPEKERVKYIFRRTRKAKLPFGFTQKDEAFALDYFNGCCAVCGRPLRDLFGEHTVAMDHWIALTDPRPDNPGTIPTNLLPLCHGINGCNNKKSNRDPVEWLQTEFGKRKAMRILERIETFFATICK